MRRSPQRGQGGLDCSTHLGVQLRLGRSIASAVREQHLHQLAETRVQAGEVGEEELVQLGGLTLPSGGLDLGQGDRDARIL